jgi:hypothetical protein
MKLSGSLRSVTYGVATYVAVVLLGLLVGMAIYDAIPHPDVALGPLAAALLSFLSAMFVTHVVAPASCGFVTARAATAKPYTHLLYVLLANPVVMAVLLYKPLTPFKFLRIEFQHYGLFWILDLLLALVGTWYGSLRAAQRADDALMQALRDTSL